MDLQNPKLQNKPNSARAQQNKGTSAELDAVIFETVDDYQTKPTPRSLPFLTRLQTHLTRLQTQPLSLAFGWCGLEKTNPFHPEPAAWTYKAQNCRTNPIRPDAQQNKETSAELDTGIFEAADDTKRTQRHAFLASLQPPDSVRTVH